MSRSAVRGTWFDARVNAREFSLDGYAWIVSLGPSAGYAIVTSKSVDDAPPYYAAAFKEGEEQ